MTFWQDARPATPRFRRRPRRRRVGSRFRRRVVAGLAVAVVAVAAVVALDRGDGGASARAARDGAEPPARRVRLRWTAPLPAWPAAMVRDGRAVVVVGGDRVSAVTIADGTRRWQTRVGRVDDRFAVHGGTVFVAVESGFVALDRATGARRWSVGSPERPGPVALVAGRVPVREAVAVASTAGGGLVGLDPATGRTRWSVRVRGHVRSPLAVDHRAGLVAGVWQADRDRTVLRVVDAATGAVRFERTLRLMAGAPAFAAGTVVVSSGDDPATSAIEAFAVSDGAPRWRTAVDAPSQPDLVPVVDGSHLVAVDQSGAVVRLRARDGRPVWRARTGALTTYARPVPVRDAVLVWNEAGEVLTLDRATGRLRARRRVAGIAVAAVAGEGTVVLAQRLLRGPPLQAFGAASIAAPARRTG